MSRRARALAALIAAALLCRALPLAADELEFNRVIHDPAGTGKPPVQPPARR